ncbi:MAG: hypothetical protein M1333_02185 [Patescibacteria group bacterium]|nr:hypothetical protein [Patescibacteria group bacterium]
MTYRSAKSFFRIFGWAGTAALALAVFVASAPTTADAYAVNYINISYPGGCQILPGDSLQTCDIDPGGTLGPFVGTMDWQAGFPSPLPAMGMGSETSYGYLPGTVPLGCTSSTAYPGATLGNSGVPTGFGGDQICEVAFNSAFAGVGQGQYMFYASPSATPGQRYYMHLSSHNPYPPVITPFYIRIRPAAVCNINSFTADNTTVGYNGSTNLRFTLSGNFAWNISTISGSGLANPSSGTSSSGVSSSGNLTNTTTYRLTCGPDSQDVTVVVPSAPVCSPANTSGSPGSGINLSASGGDGNYSWSTPSSSTFCGNSASCVVTYSSAGSYSATVTSAGRSSTCNVSVSSLCGNGVVNLGEQCDGSNLNGQTCASQGFVTGTLSCNANCTFNTSACSSSGTQSISASKLSCTGSNATYTIHAVSTANNFYIKLIDSLGSTNIMTSMNEPVTSAGGRDYTTGPWVTNNMRFQLINAGTGAVMAETNVGNTGCSSPSPTCTITASPNSGTGSVSGSLSWSSSNATSCTASGGWSGSKEFLQCDFVHCQRGLVGQ